MWAGDKSSPPPQYGSHRFELGEGLVPFRFLAQKPLFQSHRIPFDKRQSLIWKGLAKTKWGLNKGQTQATYFSCLVPVPGFPEFSSRGSPGREDLAPRDKQASHWHTGP